MRIPKSFNVLGHRVTVQWDGLDEDTRGKWSFSKASIKLHKPDDAGITREMAEHTFCHELTHCILDVMGEEELSKNEKFVDLFGGLLAQAISTMRGEL